MSLAGRRILVTRAQQQASQLAEALRAAGAEPIEIPAIAILPPHSYAHIDAAIAGLNNFDWLVFTSANAVRVFCERALYAGVHPAASTVKIAVIGPATAEAVLEAGMHVALVPQKYVAEWLLKALRPVVGGESVLLVRAEVARDVLPSGLRAAGAEVTVADAYKTELPTASVAKLKEIFSTEVLIPHAITFTSSSTARNAHALLLAAGVILPPETVLASIGPVTSNTMEQLGFEPTIEAEASTIASLVEALARHFAAN
jgi:uroporphyrinogen-III synthase